MEIQQLRKEFNQLLDKINKHSELFTDKEHFPSLEASVMLSKINKLQEIAAVLKYTVELKEDEINTKRKNFQQEQKQSIKVDEVEPEQPKVEEVIQPVMQEEPIKVEDKKEVVIEKTQENSPSSSIGDKFSQTPISSLKDAFTLNDRYLFANELFNKDMNLFNEAIKSLDSCENDEAALALLKEFGIKYNWHLENEQFLSLQNKVERRFL